MRVPVAEPVITPKDVGAVAECVASTWISGVSPYVKQFEEDFAKYIGVKHCVATSSGTTALHLAAAALGIKPGDEVIVPTFTMIASANIIRYLGAKPVFVDCDRATWCLDPFDVERKITAKTKAILPVHVYGHPCFSFNTKVLTPFGEMAIGEVVNQRIPFVYSIENGKLQLVKVTKFHKNFYSGLMFKIKPKREDEIEATPEHPFYVNGEWLPTHELNITTHIYGITNTISGKIDAKVLDKGRNGNSKKVISNSEIEGRTSDSPSSIQMATNQRKGSISETEGKNGTKNKQYHEGSRAIYGLKEAGCGSNRIFSGHDRRRRFNFDSSTREEQKRSHPHSRYLQFKQRSDRLSQQSRLICDCDLKTPSIQQNLQNSSPASKTPIFYTLDGLQGRTSIEGSLSLFNHQEDACQVSSGILRNQIECPNKLILRSTGEGYCIGDKEIESISLYYKNGFVYNLTTEKGHYLVNNILVHNCDMGSIRDLAVENDLKILEDCAESHGAEWKHRKTGSLGDAGAFSFFANKIITMGEGGAITTDDDAVAEECNWLRAHAFGRHGKHYWHEAIGFGYRMSGMQAALGSSQLREADRYVEAHRMNAYRYKTRLAPLEEKGLITFPVEDYHIEKNVYWMFSILIEPGFGISRDKIISDLEAMGVETRTFFYPLHTMPPYQTGESFPVSEYIAPKGLSLPSGNALRAEQIDYVCKCLLELAK